MAGNAGGIIGVLALQGDYQRHEQALAVFGARTRLVKTTEALSAVDALVLPGGESTALLRLLDPPLKKALIEFVQSGAPTLATCAGVILLANEVENPAQESLGLLDIRVSRNAYGRQIDSFISDKLVLTDQGKAQLNGTSAADTTHLHGIFIRAPRITRVGSAVTTLSTLDEEPVLVREKNIIAATFHPELNETPSAIHGLLLRLLD